MKNALFFVVLMIFSNFVLAAQMELCKDLPEHASLTAALKKVVAVGDSKANGGLALNMWATVVNRDGTVCSVTFTGSDWGDQWPGSRVISAQKANTANAFSLAGACVIHREPLFGSSARWKLIWFAI